METVSEAAAAMLPTKSAARSRPPLNSSANAFVTDFFRPLRPRYSERTYVLISRVMTDAEGIRNLVGTGLANLFGSLLTAAIALVVLFYINWQLTAITIVLRETTKLLKK